MDVAEATDTENNLEADAAARESFEVPDQGVADVWSATHALPPDYVPVVWDTILLDAEAEQAGA